MDPKQYQIINHLQIQLNKEHWDTIPYLRLVNHWLICTTALNNRGAYAGMIILVKIEEGKCIPRERVSVAHHNLPSLIFHLHHSYTTQDAQSNVCSPPFQYMNTGT